VLWRIVVVLCIPFALYMIAASGSRKGMGATMMAGFLFYWSHLRRVAKGNTARQLAMLGLGVCVVLASLYFVRSLPTFSRLSETLTQSGAMERESRYTYFVRGLAAVATRPLFGLGLQGFGLSGLAGAAGHYSHSTITETLCNSGVPGFAMYAASQLMIYLTLRKLRRAGLPAKDAAMVNCAMIFFLALVLFHIFSVMFENRLTWPLMGGICGYCWELNRRHGQRSGVLVR
jgi:hypothetical protein